MIVWSYRAITCLFKEFMSIQKFILLVSLLHLCGNLYSQDDTIRSEEVNIKVFRNSRSENSLTKDIRSAGLVMSGISSERIGSLQVSSANEVVRKIAGVTVMDDGKLIIRGVSPRYNVVLMDGFKAPSFDPDVRLFSLDVLPSNVLDNVKVIKSSSADYPSDFCGGIVNIETLSLPDKNEWRIQFSIGGDFQTLGANFLSQVQKESKLLGLNTVSNDLPESLKELRLDKDEVSVSDRITFTNHLEDNFYPTNYLHYIPNGKFQILRTNRLKLRKDGKSFFGSSHLLSAENTYESRILRRSSLQTQPMVQRVLNFSDESFVQTLRTSALNNFTYGNASGLRVDLKTLFVNNGEYGVLFRQGKALPGAYGENGVYENIAFKQYTTNNTFREFFISSLNLFIPTSNEKLDLVMGANFNSSNFLDQDRKSALLVRDDNPTGTSTTFDFKEDMVSTMDQLRFGRWFYSLPEKTFQIKADLSYEVNDLFKIKTGVRYDRTKRSFDLRSMGIVNKVWRDTVREFAGQLLDEYTWPYNSYKAGLSTSAAYIVGNYTKKKFKMNIGVRLEKTDFDLYSDGFESIFKSKQLLRSGTNLFPSFNGSYDISKNKVVRGAFGLSSNRPEFREYSPLEYLDIRNWVSAYGNGGLKPVSMIRNGELRFENYFLNKSYSVGCFYKQISDPVIPKTIGTNVYTFLNLHSAMVYGFELEYSALIKFNKFSLFKSLQLIGNASLNFSSIYEKVNSEIININQPMVGQSPYLLNIQITGNLKNDLGQITFSGFYQGDRTVFIGDNRNLFSLIQKTGILSSINANLRINKYLNCRLKIDNLFNVSDILYNDINNNGKLDFYSGYIDNISGDNIFSHRRDPAVFSVGLNARF